jgi:hypothetical protein
LIFAIFCSKSLNWSPFTNFKLFSFLQISSTVSKKWLIRLKKKLFKRVSMDWERVTKASSKATFPVCTKHSELVEYYMFCGLCKQKLNVGGMCTLGGMTRQQVNSLSSLRGQFLLHGFYYTRCCKNPLL